LGEISVDTNQNDRAMSTRVVERLDFTVTRLTVPVPDALEFTRRYEAAVPDLPLDAVRELVARRASWPEMERLIGGAAPFGFLIYFRNNVGPVMELAGEKSRCTAYLMGNHDLGALGSPRSARWALSSITRWRHCWRHCRCRFPTCSGDLATAREFASVRQLNRDRSRIALG
jgi:hypothetical protein